MAGFRHNPDAPGSCALTSAENEPLVQCEGVGLRFGAREIANGVAFSLGPGEVVQLVGRNGAGKSTLLDLVSRLAQPSSGKIFYSPALQHHQESARRFGLLSPRGLGRAWQDSRVFRSLTVAESLGVAERIAQLRGRSMQRLTNCAIDALGLEALLDRPCGALSLGQARRVALATTIVAAPLLTLLDEPFSGLDNESAIGLTELIRVASSQGMAFLFSEHYSNERSASDVRQRAVSLSKEGSRINDFSEVATAAPYTGLNCLVGDDARQQTFRLDDNATSTVWTADGGNRPAAAELAGLRLVRNGFPLDAGGDVGITLKLPVGSFTLLEARNGWGKTSLLRAMAGLDASSGEVSVSGKSISKLPAWRRRTAGISYAPSTEMFLSHLTVIESLQLAGALTVRDFFPESHMFQAIGSLSGGERQLLNLLLAAGRPAAIYLLDEPASMLDKANLQVFKELISTMLQKSAVLIAVPTGG